MKELTYSTAQAITALLKGSVGVLPTDTIYGLVAMASNHQAVDRLYALKSRDKKPGTVIVASTDQLLLLGIAQADIDRVAQWWPNPVSAILPIMESGYLDQAVGSLAVRVVADPRTKEILLQTGPLLTTSANLPNQPEAATIEQAYEYFGSRVDFYVDGGHISNRMPSTIIRPHSNGIEVLRQGMIHIDADFTSPR